MAEKKDSRNRLAELPKEIQIGLDAVARGEVADLDMEAIKARGRLRKMAADADSARGQKRSPPARG